jgi:hypothetical protein
MLAALLKNTNGQDWKLRDWLGDYNSVEEARMTSAGGIGTYF